MFTKKLYRFTVLALMVFALVPAVRASMRGLLDFGGAYSLNAVWTADARSLADVEGLPSGYASLRLDRAAFISFLAGTPDESLVALRDSPVIVGFPMPDGKIAEFRVQRSSVLTPELAARFPEIQSFRILGVDDEAAIGRFDISPAGVHATISTAQGIVNIIPADKSGERYATFFGAAPDLGKVSADFCGTRAENSPAAAKSGSGAAPNIALGAQLRTYRIAIATTWEYSDAMGGGTVAGTVASINTWLNGTNVIFERELSIRLLLVNNTDIIFSADRGFTAATDPFTNDGQGGEMLAQGARVLAERVGVGNYNLGHVFGLNRGGAGATDGQASLGVVCQNSVGNIGFALKGSGFTRLSNPVGILTSVTTIVHEVAHMFSADHTHNAGGCAAISPENAYEAGGGLSIMAYRGTCGNNAYGTANVDPDFFHSRSIAQITDYVVNGVGAACPVMVATNNNPPQIAGVPATFTIPRNTPFALTAVGTDADPGDAARLTYSWEQYDPGRQFSNPSFSDAGDPPTTTRPIFRPFAPGPNPTRIFPSLQYILNNANDPPDIIQFPTEAGTTIDRRVAEKLPQVARTLNFRVTVRDNVGGTNDASTVVTVDGNSGPFRVTSPNTNVTLAGGTLQTITWDAANTQNAPVSAANVRIMLSTDGGNTFPIELAASVPNNGAAQVQIPNQIASTTARIKVEAVGNIFFDISDANFTITVGGTCPVVNAVAPAIATPGQQIQLTGVNFTGVTAVRFPGNVNATFNVVSDTTLSVTVPNGAAGGDISISKNGCGDANFAGPAICATAPVTLQVDPGPNTGVMGSGRLPQPSSMYVVNRLKPATYPATLSAVAVRFPDVAFMRAGVAVRILSGTTTGPDAMNGVQFRQTPITLPTDRSVHTTYNVEPLTITSGEFVVGYVYDTPANESVFGMSSDDSPFQNRSYDSRDGINFRAGITNYRVRAVIQTGCATTAGCNATVASTTTNFTADGGNGTVAVTTSAANCPWTMIRGGNWITFTSTPNGNGTANVTFSVARNETTQPRTATISIGGQSITITQAGAAAPACTYAINPVAANLVATASAGNSIALTTAPGCQWTAATTDNWITITAGTTGAGNGNVIFSVAANPNAAQRVGRITAGGQVFTVTQAGTTSACRYQLQTTQLSFTAAASPPTQFFVLTDGNCQWTATTPDNWITLTNASGTANGNVVLTVAANPSTTEGRVGTILVNGIAVRVIQSANVTNCQYQFTAPEVYAPATAATRLSMGLNSTSGCLWNATRTGFWIGLPAASGIGSASAVFDLEANTSTDFARVGTITVGGQTLTVRQAAAGIPCLPVTGGLISLYRGELTTTDVYGGNNGDTPPTILFPPSPRGNSFLFNGSTAVTIPRRVAADFTLETWIKTNNPGPANETDWTQGAGVIANDQFGISLGNGKIMFGVAGTTITSTATVNDDNWHHVVATRVAATGTLALYIDGVAVPATADGQTGALDAGANLLFGRRGPNGAFFTGELDEIKIYNQTLSVAQATLAFNGCTTAARASVADAATREGDPSPAGETTTLNFNVTLTQPAATDVYINYQTVDGTAREGIDYVGAFGRLTIPAGQTSGVISVGLMPDNGDEDDLTFTLVLDRIAGAELADDEAVGIILDDDEPCEITLDEDSASIGAGGGNLTVEVDDYLGCGWTAASTAPWITVTGGQAGNQSATVVLSVGANTGGARIGDVVIGGNVFRVDQSAPLAPVVTLGGYVYTGAGNSVRNARVVMTGPSGTRVARTNSFGRYVFTDVPTGQTVTIAVESKGLTFAGRTVAVTVDDSSIDLATAPN